MARHWSVASEERFWIASTRPIFWLFATHTLGTTAVEFIQILQHFAHGVFARGRALLRYCHFSFYVEWFNAPQRPPARNPQTSFLSRSNMHRWSCCDVKCHRSIGKETISAKYEHNCMCNRTNAKETTKCQSSRWSCCGGIASTMRSEAIINNQECVKPDWNTS